MCMSLTLRKRKLRRRNGIVHDIIRIVFMLAIFCLEVFSASTIL